MRTTTATASKSAPRTKLSAKAKRPVKVAAAPLASKEAKRTVGETTAPKGTVPLKKLCAEIGINPKVARRELRKVRAAAIEGKEKDVLRGHDLHTRWFLSGAFLARAKEVLREYVERNGKSK